MQATRRQPPWPAANVVELPAEAGFTDWERWAWARILRGAVADLSAYPGALPDDAGDEAFAAWLAGRRDTPAEDPAMIDDWPEHRRISARFLKLILFHEPFRSAPEQPGVALGRALFPEALDWSGGETRAHLTLLRCRFGGSLGWYDGRVRGDLNLHGCVFDGDLGARRILIDGALFAWGGLRVAGRIDLRRSVTSRLELREVDLGGALLLDGARSGAVVVDASTIRTSNDHGGLVLASSARIGGAVSFTDVQTASDVHLASTRAADLQWAGGRVGGSVRADRIQIDGSCALRGARLEGDVALVGARVAGDVQLGPSEFAGVVDLTRARIGGELHLARNTVRSGPTWGPASRLVLRDVTCEAIGGGAEAFGRDPEGTRSRPRLDFVPLDLVGLRYARVVGSGAEPGSTLARADARTLCRWLEAGVSHDGFTPEPWHQLADALARAGRPDGARFVRYEMRRYELRAERRLSRRAWLWLADVLIGHGYRSGRAVVWFVLLAAAAAVAGAWLTGPPLRASAEDGALLLRWFWFALDNGLPGIELDVAHRTFLADHSPAYRPPTIGLVSLFYVHALLGLVVLAYLAAGLSGLATGDRRRG